MNEVPEKENADNKSENADAQHVEHPEGEESKEPLLDTVQRTLEELFSRQSLEDDAYMQQNMNAQMYIPLTTLASHYSIRCLADEATVLSLIKPALERSEKVVLDESGLMARPDMKPRRNTLILHDLPDNFPEEELKTLLASSPGSEAFCSLKPDVNNTAFVTFETDEAAQNVALWLRSQKLQGSGIKCAIKSEHVVRSFFPASPGILPDSSPYMGAWYSPAWTPAQDWGEEWNEATMNNMWWSDTSGWMLDEMQGDNGKGKGKGKGKGRRRGPGSFSLPDAQMEMLPRGELTQDALQQSQGDDAEVAEPGYTHQYRQYSRQSIIDTCNAMEEITKPDSYERLEQNEVALFRSSPCKDWAPPPNPLAAFAGFFNEDGKGRDSQDAEGNRRSSAASSKGSWGPRDRSKTRTQSDVSQSTDNKEESWGNGDSSWWGKGQTSSSTRRSSSHARSWSRSRGTSWDYNSYSHGDGGYHNTPHWVKKDNKTEDESPPEVLADAHSWPTVWVKKGAAKNEEESQQEHSLTSLDTIAKDLNEEKENREETEATMGRKLSWAEKVRGVKAVDESESKGAATPSSPPVAKPKGKVDGSMSPKKMPNDSSMSPMTKTLSNHGSTANQNSKKDEQIGPAPGLEAEVKTAETESKTSGTPTTWADRMRKSVSQ